MGNQHSFNIENYDFPRSTSMGFMQHIPTEPMNKHRIGKVYIMVHKTRQQQMGNVDLTYAEEKRAHHSILIDIAGASNAMELHGVWFHLTADVKTRETDFRAFSQPVPRSSLVRYSRPEPGRLQPPDNVSNPREWAALLKSQASHIFDKRIHLFFLSLGGARLQRAYQLRIVKMVRHSELPAICSATYPIIGFNNWCRSSFGRGRIADYR